MERRRRWRDGDDFTKFRDQGEIGGRMLAILRSVPFRVRSALRRERKTRSDIGLLKRYKRSLGSGEDFRGVVVHYSHGWGRDAVCLA